MCFCVFLFFLAFSWPRLLHDFISRFCEKKILSRQGLLNPRGPPWTPRTLDPPLEIQVVSNTNKTFQREKKNENGSGREKKAQKMLGLHPSGPPPFGAPSFLPLLCRGLHFAGFGPSHLPGPKNEHTKLFVLSRVSFLFLSPFFVLFDFVPMFFFGSVCHLVPNVVFFCPECIFCILSQRRLLILSRFRFLKENPVRPPDWDLVTTVKRPC